MKRAEEDKDQLEAEAGKMKLELQRLEQREEEGRNHADTELERMEGEMQRMEQKMKRINNEMEQVQEENKEVKRYKLDIDSEVAKLRISESQLRKQLADFEGREEEANERLQGEISRYQVCVVEQLCVIRITKAVN